MSRFPRILTLCLSALMLAAPAMATDYAVTGQSTPGKASAAKPREMKMHPDTAMRHAARMTTADGMSLYVFDKDSDGKSNCYGRCAREWPPMKADATATPAAGFSVIHRKDGTLQWAWKGKPLYMFDGDKTAGDMKGDGYSPDWHMATGI